MTSLGIKLCLLFISEKEEREREKGMGRGVVGCLALVLALNDNQMSKCETASAHEARESSARPGYFIKN